MEVGEGVHDAQEVGHGVRDVFGVLDVGREGGVFREGEDEGFDGRGGRQERGEERKVFGRDGDGDGEVVAVREEVAEVEEGEHVALGRIWD